MKLTPEFCEYKAKSHEERAALVLPEGVRSSDASEAESKCAAAFRLAALALRAHELRGAAKRDPWGFRNVTLTNEARRVEDALSAYCEEVTRGE